MVEKEVFRLEFPIPTFLCLSTIFSSYPWVYIWWFKNLVLETQQCFSKLNTRIAMHENAGWSPWSPTAGGSFLSIETVVQVSFLLSASLPLSFSPFLLSLPVIFYQQDTKWKNVGAGCDTVSWVHKLPCTKSNRFKPWSLPAVGKIHKPWSSVAGISLLLYLSLPSQFFSVSTSFVNK